MISFQGHVRENGEKTEQKKERGSNTRKEKETEESNVFR